MHKKIYLSVIFRNSVLLSRVKTKNNITKKVVPCFHTLYTIKYEAPHIFNG